MEHLIWSELLVKSGLAFKHNASGATERKMFMGKKLYRIRQGKIIAGVCGGIAKYFDVDPQMVRLLCVALILAYGSGLLVYIIFAIFVPKEPKY